MLRTLLPLALVVGAVLASTVGAQQTPRTQPGAPQPVPQIPIAVEPPMVDFGVVAPGSKHPATFTLRNIGTQPLTVAQAQPSCKCTDISPIAGSVIQPGGTLTLTAALSVPLTPGEKDAKVMISFLNTKGMIVANMKADVTLPIRATPAYLDALKGKKSGTIQLSSVDGKPFKVITAGGKPVAPRGPDGKPVDPQGAASQAIDWSVDGIAPTALQQWWVIETDRADCPLIPLRVRNEATGSAFDPGKIARCWFPPESVINAGRIKPGQSVEVSVSIEHLNPSEQGRVTKPTWGDVTAVRVPGGEATVELVRATKRADTFVDVVMKFTPGAGVKGVAYIPVEIETATGRGPVFVSVTVDS
jgi:hypothetical protein